MHLNQTGKEPIEFMTSADPDSTQDKDLLIVKYKRAQRESPEFESLFEGIDQNVDVQISTFIFHAEPEPVVALYDFVMTTFVPSADGQAITQANIEQEGTVANHSQDVASANLIDSKIKVLVRLDSVQGMFAAVGSAVRIENIP